MSIQPLRWLSPSLGLSSETWGDIKGHDINFPGPVYPTPVANPDLFGGQRVSPTFGLTFGDKAGILSGHSFQANFGIPVYQNLHGPQPEANWRADISWNLSF